MFCSFQGARRRLISPWVWSLSLDRTQGTSASPPRWRWHRRATSSSPTVTATRASCASPPSVTLSARWAPTWASCDSPCHMELLCWRRETQSASPTGRRGDSSVSRLAWTLTTSREVKFWASSMTRAWGAPLELLAMVS